MDNFKRYTSILSLVIFGLSSLAFGQEVNDDNDVEEFFREATSPIGILLKSQDDKSTGLSIKSLTICYDDGICENETMSGSETSSSSLIELANPEKTVVGISLKGKFSERSMTDQKTGKGVILVAEGEVEERIGPDKFEIETKIHESDTYEPGDEINFEIGELEPSDGKQKATNDPADATAKLKKISNPIGVLFEPKAAQTGVSVGGEDQFITICYEDGDCDTKSSGTTFTASKEGQSKLKISESDRTVSGIKGKVEVSSKSNDGAVIIIAEGEIEEESEDFHMGRQIFRTETLEPGDETEFEIGDVDLK